MLFFRVKNYITNTTKVYLLFVSRSTVQGKTSHKFIDMSENPIMRLYYTNRAVLFWMCAGNEAFYASLYLLYFTEGPTGKIKRKSSKFNVYFICKY